MGQFFLHKSAMKRNLATAVRRLAWADFARAPVPEKPTPEHLDDVFKQAALLLEAELAKTHAKVEKAKAHQHEKMLYKAEKHNPEVVYNALYNLEKMDRALPIYRRFMKDKWRSYDLMKTMQRLEQLHVIPDTLPTFVPRAHVKVKFGHNTRREFAHWVEPGAILPAFAAARPPTIEVQEFDATGLYTVLLVNPDVPDLEKNLYSSKLHYGLANVALDYVNHTIDAALLLRQPGAVFAPYTPLVPEKNAPPQRACLWVFRQPKEIEASAQDFDIRAFAEQHGLDAVGAHVWRQGYDRSVSGVREEYALGAGRVFHRVRGTAPLQ